MSQHRYVFLVGIFFGFLANGFALGQDKIEKLVEDFDSAKTRFVKDKEVAKQKVLAQFDALVRNTTNNNKLKAADRLALAERIKSERETFAKYEDLADNTDVIDATWIYGTAVVDKYRPVSDKFEKLLSAVIKAGDLQRATKLKTDKETFDDEHLPGRAHFAVGAFYAGSRYSGTSATPFQFGVSELQGGVFKVRAEQNMQYSGHPIFEIEGSLDGIHVEGKGLKNLQGDLKLNKCDGVVLGKTLILRLTTVTAKGEVKTSFAVLHKK